MKVIEIKRLRPTQATHGRREVQQKTGEYVALEGDDLDMAIASKLIPVVTGPGDVYAIVMTNGGRKCLKSSLDFFRRIAMLMRRFGLCS
ncbi:ParB-like protein [Caballeronia mineralivorans]|jgi:hypothetical protein|uniref:ParB-like protein n=1 Tax=Caballeronia mineralivorans TaxID=2010198 RepID=UPI0023EFDB98|nr:ParB-like protein [Caballeronia mineralivorans]